MNLNPLSLLGDSASPFIDEGDGLTSERERVRILLSLSIETWDLSLSPVCNPYYKLLVLVTRATAMNWT